MFNREKRYRNKIIIIIIINHTNQYKIKQLPYQPH